MVDESRGAIFTQMAASFKSIYANARFSRHQGKILP